MFKPFKKLSKDVPFLWVPEAQGSFYTLTKIVTTAPIIQKFHPDHRALVAISASENAIGVVL